MSLGDREILELTELCGALVDGGLTESRRTRLAQLLRESEAARRYYVRAMGQSASLHGYAAEMHADAPEGRFRKGRFLRFPAWLAIGFAAAAALAVGLFFPSSARRSDPVSAPAREEFVARLTAAKDSEWHDKAAVLQPGAYLRRGQRIELDAGYLEITFDSGARVVIEGAASLDINSAWDATLRHGTLKASVPAEAIGFRISNPFVDVFDLGTEFTIIADAKGATEVLVNKGAVEAAPRTSGDFETILLRENEARRFAESGVSDVSDRERKLALFNQPLALERFAPAIKYVHWAFDETTGALRADGPLAVAGASDVELLAAPPAAKPTRVESGRQRALRFDGQTYAKARLMGISSSMPRTVAFWVKVPVEAQPLDTWMVAWGTKLRKLGYRPVHISWNRRPGDGALGALRTDFGGGHAIGTMSLRDGKWHHIAVYFAVGENPDSPVQVKQYVDGRLESSTIVPGLVRAPAGKGDATIADTVWLGYRLTGRKQEGRRFRGEIDELFIADRALQPSEIVSLMKDNRLPVTGLAIAR